MTVPDTRGLSNKIGRLMDNAASSFENNTTFAVKLYSKRNGRGTERCFAPTPLNQFVNLVGFDNVVSSTRVTGRSAC